MKFYRLFLLIIVLTPFINSCKKDKNTLVEIDYQYPFQDMMEIDMYNVDTFVTRETMQFPTMFDGDLAKKNTSKEKIRSARLTSLRLQMWDWAYEDTVNHCNIRELSEIRLSLNAEGLGAKEVAYKIIPDVKTNAINFDLNDVDIKEYLQKESFSMIIKYKKRRAMPHDMPFIISTKFKIFAETL